MARFLVPAGADVAASGHEAIIPFSARGSQGSTVSIFATGENGAFAAKHRPVAM